jgi:hypothetical protein
MTIDQKPVMHLYLHVGQPKSGTTAIQRAFAHYSDEDPAPIIYYPKAGRRERKLVGHHNLAYELHDPAKFRADLGSWYDMAAEVREKSADKVLISTEAFRGFLAPVVSAKIRKLFPEAALSVVLYLRPQWEYVESGYNQLMRFAKTDLSLDEFWAGTGKRICDYRATVEIWDKAVGKQAVHCLPFDKTVREKGVVRHFVWNALKSESKFDDTARVNNRIGLMAMSGVRYSRDRMREVTGQPDASLPAGIVMQVSHLFRGHERETLNYSFLSPELANDIYDTTVDTNRWLAARYPAFDIPEFLKPPELGVAPLVRALPGLSNEDKAACDEIVQSAVTAKAWMKR